MIGKKGDKVLSIYWFVILFLVVAGLIYVVASFNGPYDVRKAEANILINKVADCLSQGGVVNDAVFPVITNDNFEELCHLNFEVEDSYGWDKDQFYVNAWLGSNDYHIATRVIQAGNPNLANSCSDKINQNPYCINKKFYVLDKQGASYVIDIKAVVRKTEKNSNDI